jgi:nitric oxide reductase NorE protein
MSAATQAHGRNHLPGEAGIWVLVFGDLTFFALFFCAFAFYRGQELDLYRAAQASLNRHFGILNTIFLLTSSWFVVLAVQAARQQAAQYAAKLMAGALACGLGFALVKILEYSEKVRVGITPASNDFYMYYYVLTGIHFVHVLVGLGVLLWMRARLHHPDSVAINIGPIECGAIYWHMVDVLWVVLFALLYLMP